MGLACAIKVGGAADTELANANVVEVHERMGEPTTYRLEYSVDIGDGDITKLADARLAPGSELAVVVPLDNADNILCWGPVHSQRIQLKHGGTDSTVEVIGCDKSVEMDREVKIRIWDSVTTSDVVSNILGEYGLTPDTDTTNEQHIEDKHTLIQRETDLRFIRRLARRYGYLFWITTDAVGLHTGHFKRPALDGESAATLIINNDGSNLNALDIQWDVERPTSAIAAQVNLNDKEDITGDVAATPLTALGAQALASIATGTRNVQVIAPVDDSDDLTARAEGAVIEAGWFIRASGETYLHALSKLIRTHTVVEVQGAGSLHSGKYFVAGVRHLIDSVSYTMEFQLVRNAWGAQ
jgi:hypothetical protein